MNFYGISISTPASSRIEMPLEELRQVMAWLRPKATPKPLIRIGGECDGAYLVPNDLEGIEACFSPGVNNFKYFEDELVNVYDIPAYMCDKTSDESKFSTPIIRGRQSFIKKWVGPGDRDDLIALDTWVDLLAPGDKDLLLQMDIEGAEYENILSVSDSTLSRFRIILIEIHAVTKMNDPNIFTNVFQPFFARLSKHFVCVHVHPNNAVTNTVELNGIGMSVPYLLELTLLRRDRFSEIPGSAYTAAQLPHPLDIAMNASYEPPMFLPENWLDGPPSLPSLLRKTEIERDYYAKQLLKAQERSMQTPKYKV